MERANLIDKCGPLTDENPAGLIDPVFRPAPYIDMHVPHINSEACKELYSLRGEEEIHEGHSGRNLDIRGEPDCMIGALRTVDGVVVFGASETAIDEEWNPKRVSELLQRREESPINAHLIATRASELL